MGYGYNPLDLQQYTLFNIPTYVYQASAFHYYYRQIIYCQDNLSKTISYHLNYQYFGNNNIYIVIFTITSRMLCNDHCLF